MRPLHLRVILPDPPSSELVAFVEGLRGMGHLVTRTDRDEVPPGFPQEAELLITADTPGANPLSLDAAEARHIAAVLRLTGGNKRQTALLLGVARSTLLAKIRRYGITT